MAYRIEKGTEDIIIDGWETGIAPSPHKGIANIQNANISTELGEVTNSFQRTQNNQAIIAAGTLTASVSDGTTLLATSSPLRAGTWITISASTITSISATIYYVSYQNGSGKIKLSSAYDPNNSLVITHGTSGTATFSTTVNLSQPIAKAFEKYSNASGTQYRYYILDNANFVWVYDSGVYATTLANNGVGQTWFLPDKTVNSGTWSGIAILNGWLHTFSKTQILVKPTVDLGLAYAAMVGVGFTTSTASIVPHFAYVGHQGKMYYTDNTYIGSIFPDTSLITAVANIQSYASYTAATTTGTITNLISGSIPNSGVTSNAPRIPAVFFTDQFGTQPTNLSANTVYYIAGVLSGNNFTVFAAASGGSAINIASGATGNQYFNTYFPLGTDASVGGTTSTIIWSAERVNLPNFEVAQCLVEIGNIVLIGCTGNVVYSWDQISATPNSIISLPEGNTQSMLTVNQMAYLFVGNQGNVYITDGSVASLVINVPDYVAGVPGTPTTYIESTYTWGDSMYLRGRVYFSILDQTTTKAGNCGGVWCFVPTQNLYIGQDTGIALRLEAENSYGTYNGVNTVLIPDQNQNSQVPLHWNAWYSSVSAPIYGIDYSSTSVSTTLPAIVETDAIPVGTMLGKKTFQRQEFKVSSPLLSSDSVTLFYRQNITSAWTSCGTVKIEPNRLSGYFSANFEKSQWLQLRILLNAGTTSSFIRLTELRIH